MGLMIPKKLFNAVTKTSKCTSYDKTRGETTLALKLRIQNYLLDQFSVI